MANLVAVARTNYFRVVDIEAFKVLINGLSAGLDVAEGVGGDRIGKVCLIAECGWPDMIFDEDTDDDVEFLPLLQLHIAKGEIVVVTESGHESMRYCYGRAFAFTCHGILASVSTEDIYQLVGALLEREDHGLGIDKAGY